MKQWIIVVLIALFCVPFADAKPAKPAKKVQTGQGTPKTVQAKAPAAKAEPCKAYIVVEALTGKVVEGENIHEKRPPASVTKLMVALVVLEKLASGQVKLTDQITTSKEASKIGGSQVYLEEGEAFSLGDMMKAILVASGNDAAYAVAEHIAGSKDEFVKLMNEKAKALNMVDTEFRSVHGLPPSKGQEPDLTSASDLAILARELLKYPQLLQWTSLKSEPFRDGKFIMNNHNKLLTKMGGVDGLKTGYYGETGFNVVATAVRNDMRFIVVVLGSPSANIRDSVAIEKFKKAFSRYKMLNVVKRGEVIDKNVILVDGKYPRMKGVAGANFAYPIPNDKKGTVQKEIVMPAKISGEIREGQRLGELIVKFDNEVIGKVDIVSPVYVPKANLFTRFIRRLGLNI
ncbi:MAG: D-alanyl-D-alanine carboxypeptidase DacF precursor [Syntrophorhabdus sp. PtaB.Bin006]|nr:MAG: D-alanyl-D-alanine carboxypeptidase DacF precursor [Syntrophorhabdus sp. PtaB.Bin006]